MLEHFGEGGEIQGQGNWILPPALVVVDARGKAGKNGAIGGMGWMATL